MDAQREKRFKLESRKTCGDLPNYLAYSPHSGGKQIRNTNSPMAKVSLIDPISPDYLQPWRAKAFDNSETPHSDQALPRQTARLVVQVV